jgi:hypothetical protein
MALDGVQEPAFKALTRRTVDRYVDDMTTEQLLDLLGHLIVSRRSGYKRLMKQPAAPAVCVPDGCIDPEGCRLSI